MTTIFSKQDLFSASRCKRVASYACQLLTIATVALTAASFAGTAPVPKVERNDYAILSQRALQLPVSGVRILDLHDSYREGRAAGNVHQALDIAAPRGTPVVAVGDGVVAKLFNSKAGGLTVYLFDIDKIYCYYYAHLDRYADGLKEGQRLRRGEVLGYVGSTGNTSPQAPHLHFAIFKLGPEKRWWQGAPINPHPILAQKTLPSP